MAEYIEREALLEKAQNERIRLGYDIVSVRDIGAMPAADVAPVRHGKIIETIEDGHMKRTFSCCGTDFTQMTCWMTPNYCPNCGARMDGDEKC